MTYHEHESKKIKENEQLAKELVGKFIVSSHRGLIYIKEFDLINYANIFVRFNVYSVITNRVTFYDFYIEELHSLVKFGTSTRIEHNYSTITYEVL